MFLCLTAGGHADGVNREMNAQGLAPNTRPWAAVWPGDSTGVEGQIGQGQAEAARPQVRQLNSQRRPGHTGAGGLGADTSGRCAACSPPAVVVSDKRRRTSPHRCGDEVGGGFFRGAWLAARMMRARPRLRCGLVWARLAGRLPECRSGCNELSTRCVYIQAAPAGGMPGLLSQRLRRTGVTVR